MVKSKRLLFICLGNIIRSPLAANIFRHYAKESGLDSAYEVDSAGTGPWHVGEPPDARMRRTALEHGVRYSGRARRVERDDLDESDLILVMDENNLRDILALSPDVASKVHLLRDFDGQSEPGQAVPDPYYGGIEGFENTFRIVERSVRGLLDALERGEQ